MKKILTTLAVSAMLAATASADLGRVEMGAGVWQQTPSGANTYAETGAAFEDKSQENSQSEGYVWMLVKHPIPIIPNLRLEYVNALNEGTYNIISGTPIGGITTGTTSELEVTQFDIIPYYNILDNTGWVTLDLGLDIKVMDISYSANGIDIAETLDADVTSLAIPLGYVRARVQIPATDLGFEADVKYVTYDDDTVLDARVKVDYTFDITPVIQPGIEVGYRIQTFDIEDSGLIIDTEFQGVYAGLMLRF